MVEVILEYLSLLLILLIVLYGHRIHYFYRGLGALPHGKNTHKFTVSIIVPARNEEQNIERCLDSLVGQNYPKDRMTIIVIDDQSEDGTANLVRSIAEHSSVPVLLFATAEYPEIKSPKLRALAHGIQHAPGSIILTTDADCTAPADWVASIVSYFEEGIGVVTGLTTYEKKESISPLFRGIQFLDFLSYSAIAAGAIGWKKMLISNGSNMAFRRDAFDGSGGFERLKHINTGDDSLLGQNITGNGVWTPGFALSSGSVIVTQPVSTLREFLHQRLRWVGQTAYYPAYMMFFMISTFIMFVVFAISLPLTFFQWNPVPWIVLFVKFIFDYATMSRFTRLMHVHEAMRYFIPTAIIHIPMILIATVGGYFFSFEWKDRAMKKESAA